MGGVFKWATGAAAVLVASGAAVGPMPAAGATQGAGSAQARAALLRLGDFPHGWKASEGAGSTSPTTVTRAVASCESAPTSGFPSGAPHATSPRFSEPNQPLTVTEAVSVYPSAAVASREYAAYSNAKAAGCLVSYLQQSLDKHAGGAGVTAGQTSGNAASFPRYADGTAAFEMTVPVSVKGFSGNVEVEAVVLRTAASLAYLTMTSVGTAFPSSLAHQLAAKAAQRLHG